MKSGASASAQAVGAAVTSPTTTRSDAAASSAITVRSGATHAGPVGDECANGIAAPEGAVDPASKPVAVAEVGVVGLRGSTAEPDEDTEVVGVDVGVDVAEDVTAIAGPVAFEHAASSATGTSPSTHSADRRPILL